MQRSTHHVPGKGRQIRALVLCLIAVSVLLVSSLLWFSTIWRNATPRARAASGPPPMGVNLTWPGDSDGDFLFADTFKTYRIQAAPGQSNPPSVDANGWPQGDFTAFLWDGSFLTHTTGSYALRFNGQATLSVGLVSASINNQTYDSASNTTTVTIVINQDSSAQLAFTNTQRTNGSASGTGVTNIQMMRPVSPGSSSSYSFSTTFTDAMKNFLTPFQAIRFMDYTGANGNTEVNWSDRVLPQGSQESRGAWEYAIQLCNELGKDGYINVPLKATDAYITSLATLVRYGSDANGNVYTSTQSSPVHPPLNSNLHLYIEYSNEVWNGAFQQFHDNYNSAVAEVNAGGSPLNYDGETGTYQWGWRRIAKRIHDISNLFRSVFGDAAMPPNSNAEIRPIFEWQYGNAQDTAHQGFSFLDNYYGNADGIQHVSNPHPVNYFLWGGGGAAYSGVNDASGSTVDAIYNSGYSTGVVPGTVSSDVGFIYAYGLQHDIAYEGGFQIGGDGLSALQKQANLDARAQQMEVQTQTLFNQAGGDLLMYFDSTSSNYGLAIPTVLDSTPKLQAIQQLAQSTEAAPTNGTLLPAAVSINSGSFVSGNRVDALVNSPSASTYSATLNLQTGNNANTLQVLVNNAVVQTVTIPQTSQQNTDFTLNNITLNAGLNGISFRGVNSTSTTLNSLTLSSGNFTPPPASPTPTSPPTQSATLPTATTAPTIDGNSSDAIWGSAPSYALNNATGAPSGFSASYQSAWDSSNLYMLVKIQDSGYPSHADAVELYLDPNRDSGTTYDHLDMQYQFPSNATTVTQYNGGQQGTNIAGIAFANAAISGGYQVELKIPWSTLGVTPAVGNQIGLDMDAWQNTASGSNKLFWNSTSDVDWTNPSKFGTGTLQGQGGSTPTPSPTPTPGGLPSPWQQQDIGAVGSTGSASYSAGTFTVTGSGTDIWDTSDAFQYAYQTLNGDGSIIARVASVQNTDPWAKAGVMIRETLTASSTQAFMAITSGNGSAFQRRTTTGGTSAHTGGPNVTAPYWVMLVRSGTTFTGSISSDGSSWTQVGSDTISMATNVYVGLAVTAHNNAVLNSSTFSNVSVSAGGGGTPTPTPTPSPTPSPTSGTLLASDSLSGSNGALNGVNDGTGWSNGWSVQNADTAVPGYNISNTSAPSYSNLQTSGSYAVGGSSYLTAGRNLNVSSGGPFNSYLSNGQIGKAGTTLWVSFLLRKDAANGQETSVYLHDNGLSWCSGCASALIGAGYFGSASETGGTRYWSLSLGGTVYKSATALAVGQAALLVLRIDFNASNTTVSLYVNPSSLGGSAPSASGANATSSSALTFQSVAYYGGDGSGQSALDELRFGTTYASVTPTH